MKTKMRRGYSSGSFLRATHLAALLTLLALILGPRSAQANFEDDEYYWYQSLYNAYQACEAMIAEHAAAGETIFQPCVVEPWPDGLSDDWNGLVWGHTSARNVAWYYTNAGSAPQEKNRGKPCPDCIAVGDPINSSNGNKYEIRPEFKGEGPFPLEFVWTYNSSGVGLTTSSQSKVLGINRTHNYAVSAQVLLSTDGNATPLLTVVMREDGKVEKYKNVGGAWAADANNPAKFVSLTNANGVVTGYQRTGPDRTVELFGTDGRLLSIRNPAGLVQTLEYEPSGLLSKVTDPQGRYLTFSYTSGLLTLLGLPDGQALGFTYDSANKYSANLTAVVHPDLRTSSFVYNEAGLAPAGAKSLWTGELDSDGVRYATTSYDSRHRATGTFLGDGKSQIAVSYITSSDKTYSSSSTVAGPLGQTETMTFQPIQGQPRLTSRTVSCPGCTPKTQSATYDSLGQVDVATDFNGYKTDHDYSVSGLLTQKIESTNGQASRRTTQISWNELLRAPSEYRLYDSSGSKTPGVLVAKVAWTYNSRGQILTTSRIDPGSATNKRVETFTYCEQAGVTAGTCPIIGLALSVNGPRTDVNDVTTFSYYASDDATCASSPMTCPHRKGDLWKVTNALNQVTEVTAYDGAGRILQVRDPNNVVTDLEYSERGLLTHLMARGTDGAVETDDAIIRFDYNSNSLLSKLTGADGEFVTFDYDGAHRLVGIGDAAGNSITYTLDNAGNRTDEVTNDAANSLTRKLSKVYDSLGRLQATKNAAGTSIASVTYDRNNNLDTTTDALTRVSDQNVDPLNRVVKTIGNVGGINATTSLTYDARDNLTKVVDPKNLNTVYSFNGLNDLSQVTSPDTGAAIYTYDSAGNLKTKKDAKAVTTTYNYDALNRLVSQTYATSALNSSFVYDVVNPICGADEEFAKGRLTRFDDPSGNTQYCYDRFGHITRKQVTNNGAVSTFLFAYTKGGRLSGLTYPSGLVAKYFYDSSGQATQVDIVDGVTTTTLIDNVAYLPFGPLKELHYPGGASGDLTQTRSYDSDYVVQSVGGLEYDFDVMGNLKSLVDPAGGNVYEYDNLDRLTKVKNSTTLVDVRSFTYDPTGDRISKKTGPAAAQVYTYASTSHRLTNVGGVARTYDANGNTTQSAATKIFTYDGRNRLVDSRTGSASSTIVGQYQFNAKGERVRKYLGATDLSRYQFDEDGRLLVQTRFVNGVPNAQEIVWLGDMPVGVKQNGALYGVLTDHLNSPRAVFELSTLNVVWRWDLADDAFGENLAVEDPDADGVFFKFDLRFPGQYFDAETGINYNYFRDYDPGVGRYVESDPIGLHGGLSTYGYVGGSPLVGIDPYGLAPPGCGSGKCVGRLPSHWRPMGNGMMSFVHPDPLSLVGREPFRNEKNQVECVDVVKMGFDDPILRNTSAEYGWRQGPKVDENTPIGTAVASGWENGRYPARASNNHAALLTGISPYSLHILDQYANKPKISQHEINRYPGPNTPAYLNGGDTYIILWDRP